MFKPSQYITTEFPSRTVTLSKSPRVLQLQGVSIERTPINHGIINWSIMIKYKHDHQYNHIIYCNDDSKKTICEHSMILSNSYHIDYIVAMFSHHVFPTVFLPAQASAIRRSGGAASLSTEGEAAGVAAILVVLAVLVATVGTHGRHLGIGRCRWFGIWDDMAIWYGIDGVCVIYI